MNAPGVVPRVWFSPRDMMVKRGSTPLFSAAWRSSIQPLHPVHVATAAPVAAVGGRDAPGAFAVVLEAHAVAPAQVPKVSGGGNLHFLVAGQLAVRGIGENPGALVVVGGDRRVAPTVAVHADFAIAIQIVEQDVFAGELVVVGGHRLAVNGELRIAVAGGLAAGIPEVAQHLVVGAVFLDDVEDILDGAGVADFGGDHRIAGQRSALELVGRVGRVAPNLAGVSGHLGGVRARDEGDRAAERVANIIEGLRRVRLARIGGGGRGVGARSEAFAVGDEEGLVVGADRHRRRIPADRDEPFDHRHRLAVAPRLLRNALEMSTTITQLLSALATKSVWPSGETATPSGVLPSGDSG